MMQRITRRSLLAGMTAAGVGALGLAGCTTADTPGTGNGSPGSSAGSNILPTFHDPVTVTPDLVSKYQGMSAFFHYPAEVKPSVPEPPLKGETVTALTYTYDPIAPALPQNPMWQAVNAAIGGTLDISYTASADYTTKLSTTLAGDDLPDFVSILSSPPAQYPALLKAKFTDLTEYLAGDAIKDYPNLAGIPTQSWQGAAVVGGRLWGVPIARVPVPGVGLLREDILTKAGLSTKPSSFAELTELLKALTVPDKKQFGSGDPGAIAGFLAATRGLSNGWTEKDGAFLYDIEAEGYEQVLADVAALSKAGVFHPDSLTATNNIRNDWFTNGTTPLVFGGYAGWSKYEAWGEAVPGFKLAALEVFGEGGITPVYARGNVQASTTLIKKTDPERVKLLLGLLNWLAGPFGSSEDLLKFYGVKDTTYTLDGTDPILTESGKTLRLVPFQYVGSGPQVIYDPGKQRVSEDRFNYQEKALPLMQPDPTAGLYSETATSKLSLLNRTMNDVKNAILVGRQPVSDWKAAVDTWRSGGGDTIRKEYEEAFAEAKGR